MIVVDASVAVKWLVIEDGAASANQLFADESTLVVPSHARIEVTGAVLRKQRDGILSEAEVRQSIGIWTGLLADDVVQVIEFDQVLENAIAIAMDTTHALADCLYIATAVHLDAELVTADQQLQKRGKRAYPRITLLSGTRSH